MPERSQHKAHPHPWTMLKDGQVLAEDAQSVAAALHVTPYAELQVTTNFSFLRGASHPDELVIRAADLRHRAIGVTDRNTLAGVVRAYVAAQQMGIQLVVGCRLDFTQPAGLSMLVYPTDVASYGRLCRLLTLGKRRAEKGQCDLRLHDLLDHHEGLLAILLPPAVVDMDFVDLTRGLAQVFDGDRLSLGSACLYGHDDHNRLAQVAALAEHTGTPMVAVNDVHYHVPQRAALQDVLTCIRHGCTIEQAGYRLMPNAERCLKPPDEMARLFADYPDAIARTVVIARRASGFSLDQIKYQYPSEVVPEGQTPMAHLTELAWAGAKERYPDGLPARVRQQIEHELALIEELDYAHYFLTVHDLVVFARSRGILCQGRGAAANSAVCYCLGVTSVDPERVNLLFERFVSRERDEPPDIDVDFEHERREEVIQYLYEKYGRHRAALTGVVTTYRGRSAVRDVGKALGLSLDAVDRLAKNLDWWDKTLADQQLKEMGFNPREPIMRHLLRLVREIAGFPRHLSQHVGGFVITQAPLSELVPIENAAMEDRTVIEWDKDDIDAMGMMKVDVLSLGMLTCIRKAFDLIEQHHGQRYTLASVPAEDKATYDMICRADTVGVFQIESRAQMSMLPRLKPRCYYDLVIEVAIVRPGPIQGQMVHPYLRRRRGDEPVSYPSEAVKGVLAKTLGVPLFQEQVMSLAVVAAGFTPDEADQLRRAIAAWKSRGHNRIMDFQDKFIHGMLERGYPEDFAHRCFEQIKGFGNYGFPESHAASFALLVYVSCWLKCHYPAAFAAALLNSQPMGFYAPAQIVRDAKQHDVAIRPVDVNHSQWDCTLEDGGGALRLGMRQVQGMRDDQADAVAQAVTQGGPFRTIERLWRQSSVQVQALRRLAAADAFGSMGLDRQQALWQVRALRDEDLPLFDQPSPPPPEAPPLEAALQGEVMESPAPLPEVPLARQVVQDYQVTGLSLKGHPIGLIREALDQRSVITAAELMDESRCPAGRPVRVAGHVLVRQRPSTASGVIFMTLEDETGIANLIVRPHIFDRDRAAARHSVLMIASGAVERDGQVVHLMTHHIEDVGHLLKQMNPISRDFH